MAGNNEVKIVVKGENKSKPAITDAQKNVEALTKSVEKIPDKKVIDVKVEGDKAAISSVKKVDAEKVADKKVTIKGDDQASSEIAKVSKEKPEPVIVPVKVEKPDTGDIGGELKDKFKGYGEKAGGVFGTGLVAGLATGDFAGALSDIFSDALAAAQESKQVKIDLENTMGITPAAAKDYGARVGNQYAAGLGDSQDQIVQAYSGMSSAVKTWSSMSVSEQDKVTKSAVKIAQAFHIDVNDAIKAASSMMDNNLTTSWDTAFDVITTGLQTLGPKGDDFLETLTEYSGYFNQLGIDAPQVLGLIRQGIQGGARDTDFMVDAWKELGIRVIDGSTQTMEALRDLGLATEKHVKEKVGGSVKDVTKIISELPQAIAAGGPGAEKAIEQIVAKLNGMKDPVEKNRLGVALFGTQWEDTLRRVIGSLDLAGAKQTAFFGATDKLVTQSESQGEIFSRRWEKGLAKFGEGLATGANKVTDFVDHTVNDLVHAFGSVGGGADDAGGKVNHLFGEVNKLVDKAITISANTVDEKKIQSVAAQLKGLPPNTPVKVEGITNEAEGRLRDLGYTVTHLPGGFVTVSANTSAAVKNIEDLVWWINQRQANVPVVVTTSTTGALKNKGGGMVNKATGGAVGVSTAASGGARGNLVRVNERGPELGREQDGTIRDLESGTVVFTAEQSSAIMSGQGPVGAGGGPMRVELSWAPSTGNRILDAIQAGLMAKVSQNGGSVDRLFGGNRK